MSVDIDLYGPYRDIVGSKRISVSIASETPLTTTIEMAVDQWPNLANRLYTEQDNLTSGVILLRNGTPISKQKFSETTVTPGDTLSIAPAVSGGNIVSSQ